MSVDPRRNGDGTPRRGLVLAVAAVALISLGCGDDDSDAAPTESSQSSDVAEATGEVAVSLNEWDIVAPAVLDAGKVTLAVENAGTMNHQLSVVAAESYESLPLRDDGSVKLEELESSQVVLVTEPLFAGFPAESFEVDLEPGSYVFLCNLQSEFTSESHVGLGQRLEVTVG